MIYIEEGLKNRLTEMKLRWLNGQLTEDELKEFDSFVDEIVIEARRARSHFVRAIAEAPAPLMTILIVSIFLFVNSTAITNAAAEMMAVPCWSS